MTKHKQPPTLAPDQELIPSFVPVQSQVLRALEVIAARELRSVPNLIAWVLLQFTETGVIPRTSTQTLAAPSTKAPTTQRTADAGKLPALVRQPTVEQESALTNDEITEMLRYVEDGLLVAKGDTYVGITRNGKQWRTLLTNEQQVSTVQSFRTLDEAALARGRQLVKTKPLSQLTPDHHREIRELIADKSLVPKGDRFVGVYQTGKRWRSCTTNPVTSLKDWSPMFATMEEAALHRGRIISERRPADLDTSPEYIEAIFAHTIDMLTIEVAALDAAEHGGPKATPEYLKSIRPPTPQPQKKYHQLTPALKPESEVKHLYPIDSDIIFIGEDD